MPGVYLSASPTLVRNTLESAPDNNVRMVIGYAGWGAGQLDVELAQGSWLLAPVDSELIFETSSEAMWEAALRPASRSPFGAISEELYEWCADEFAPYPGADKIAVGRIEPPPGGWWGTRTRRGGAIPGIPVTVVTRGGADPSLRLRDTTFRLVRH